MEVHFGFSYQPTRMTKGSTVTFQSDPIRIAFAKPNDDARDATLFVETVLFNRGLPGKVFCAEEEARRWLFSGSCPTLT